MLKNDILRIEIAPSVEEAATLKTEEDWNKVLHEWMTEMEEVANKKDKKGKPKSLDFKNSQWLAMCHFDSGKPHIHLIVNRVREDGTLNKDFHIGTWATRAANAVNKQRGWKQSAEIHNEKIEKIYNDAMDILRAMPRFNWNDYKNEMEKKGHKLSFRKDRNGKVVSYRVGEGNSSYKASEIGSGKKLTASHIFVTWLKEHPEAQYGKDNNKNLQSDKAVEETRHTSMVEYSYTTDSGMSIPFAIPQALDDTIQKEIEVPEELYDDSDLDWNEEWDYELADRPRVARGAAAMLLGLMMPSGEDGPAVGSGGGGVQGELSRWDGLSTERQDEYIVWARMAAHNANEFYRPSKVRKGRKNSIR